MESHAVQGARTSRHEPDSYKRAARVSRLVLHNCRTYHHVYACVDLHGIIEQAHGDSQMSGQQGLQDQAGLSSCLRLEKSQLLCPLCRRDIREVRRSSSYGTVSGIRQECTDVLPTLINPSRSSVSDEIRDEYLFRFTGDVTKSRGYSCEGSSSWKMKSRGCIAQGGRLFVQMGEGDGDARSRDKSWNSGNDQGRCE